MQYAMRHYLNIEWPSVLHFTNIYYLNQRQNWAWINNYTHIRILYVITYPCLNFNDSFVKKRWSFGVYEPSVMYPTEIICVITYPCLDGSETILIKDESEWEIRINEITDPTTIK